MGQIQYSEKYFDDYEYRHVVLPPEVAKMLPKNRSSLRNQRKNSPAKSVGLKSTLVPSCNCCILPWRYTAYAFTYMAGVSRPRHSFVLSNIGMVRWYLVEHCSPDWKSVERLAEDVEQCYQRDDDANYIIEWMLLKNWVASLSRYCVWYSQMMLDYGYRDVLGPSSGLFSSGK